MYLVSITIASARSLIDSCPILSPGSRPEVVGACLEVGFQSYFEGALGCPQSGHNLLGEPIDNRGPIEAEEYRSIHAPPPDFEAKSFTRR